MCSVVQKTQPHKKNPSSPVHLPLLVITQHAPLPSVLNALLCVHPPQHLLLTYTLAYSPTNTSYSLNHFDSAGSMCLSCRGSCVDDDVIAASLPFQPVKDEGVVSVRHSVSVTPEAATC